jgi:uncharacterized protein YeaO (DUF488 family)
MPAAKKIPAKKKSAAKTIRRFLIKRIYEAPAKDDGLRVLVDRLWPRGIAKAKAQIDLWLRDLAPSDALRHIVHDDPTTWDDFVKAYGRELKQEPAKSAVTELRKALQDQRVTLLYAARNEERNNAVALVRLLKG